MVPQREEPRRNNLPIILGAVAVLALVVFFSVYFVRPASQGDIIAAVNGVPITRDEVFDRMFQQVGESTVDSMVVDILVEQEAERQGVEVTEEDMTRAMDRLASFFGSEEALSQALTQYGITMDDLRRDLTIQITAEKCLAERIDLSEEDKRNFFEENSHLFGTASEATVSHILVQTEADGHLVLDQLDAGESFEDMAQVHSLDPGSRDQGGFLGAIYPGDMVSEFEEAAFALEVGEISGLVESSFGFHIIKVHDRQEGHTPDFEEVRDQVEHELLSHEAGDMIPGWLEELRQKADIERFGP